MSGLLMLSLLPIRSSTRRSIAAHRGSILRVSKTDDRLAWRCAVWSRFGHPLTRTARPGWNDYFLSSRRAAQGRLRSFIRSIRGAAREAARWAFPRTRWGWGGMSIPPRAPGTRHGSGTAGRQMRDEQRNDDLYRVDGDGPGHRQGGGGDSPTLPIWGWHKALASCTGGPGPSPTARPSPDTLSGPAVCRCWMQERRGEAEFGMRRGSLLRQHRKQLLQDCRG